jgi:DNA-binding transcriptional ArsR family regulator
MSSGGLPGYVGPVSANAGPGLEQPARDQPTRGQAARDQAARDQVTPIRDAAVMRAMAHPARLALLEHLRNSGPATATECAGVVGLSPSATSYHLRALARAGLVQAAPGRGDGRERLWRITAERYQVTGVADLAPEAREALRTLLESLLAWDDARVRRYLSQLDTEPPDWQDAAFFMDSTLQVTAEELTALGHAVQELIAPYRKERRRDRPPGTRPVSLAVRALPS